MPLYLNCYTNAEDLLRAAQTQLSSYDYNAMHRELEQYDLSKDELAEELSKRHSLDIELYYPGTGIAVGG